ncbi:MAG: hypothetical protein VYA32_08195 [Planctomycetota bacterium]|nr:hypothetical protein [Planctomycetota bacterium]
MTIRSVLVLGDSPHASGLIDHIDRDPLSRIQPDTAELPDLVILAGPGEDHLAVALSLLESQRPLVIVVGPHLDTAVVHRIALVAADTNSQVRCWLPALAGHPRSEDPPGETAPIRIDRADNRPPESLLFSDLALLGRLAGRFDQVTATLATTATVTLSADNGTTATWTHRTTSDSPTASLHQGDTPLELTSQATADPVTETEWSRITTGSTHLELDELVDLVETFAAILESARRRRAIDLHHEPTSERTVFKSQMAAVGCLLLLLTLLGLVILLVLGAVLDPTGTRGGRADQVGFLLKDDAFQPDSSDLSQDGAQQLKQIAGRIHHVRVPIVVAATSNTPLDDDRRSEIEKQLDQQGIQVTPGRIVIDTPPAAWMQTLLGIARVAWIAPLILFLVLQGLILATRGKPGPGTARVD